MRKIFALLFMFVISTCYLYAQDADVNLNYKGHIAVPIFTEHPLVTTASWTSLPPTPHGQSRTACTYIEVGGTAYIYQFGGGSGSLYKNVARFNFTTNSWTNNVSTMPWNISSGTAITVGDSLIYVFGGQGSSLGKTLKWNVITNTWTTMANMTTLVTDAAVVKYRDSLVYVIGGGTGLFGSGYKNTVQIYHLNTNTYTSGGTYPIIAGMQGVGIYGDTIICAGGWTGSGGTPNAYKGIINPTTLQVTWTPIPNYPTGGVTRMGSFFVVKGTGGGVVFTGGAIGGATVTSATNFWNFCTQTWETGLPNNSTAASNFKGCGAGDSIMYIVAGYPTTTRFEKITFSQIDGNCMGGGGSPGFPESFEGTTFPPAGWIKFNVGGGAGWNRQPVGTSPIPGWTGGVITAPPGGENAVAFCTWNTGGTTSNDQYLVTPQISGINFADGDSITYWLKRSYDSYADTVELRVSTTTPTAGGFTNLLKTHAFVQGNGDTLWTRHSASLSSFTGQNIYVAWREKVADNYNNGAAISLDLVDIAGTIVGVTNNQTPVAYDLSQNYPNPFNPTTTINFSISKPGLVTLKVYNVLGKEIATLVNDPKVAGSYSVNFNGENLSSGVYFYRLEANDFVAIKKMVLTK